MAPRIRAVAAIDIGPDGGSSGARAPNIRPGTFVPKGLNGVDAAQPLT